MVARGDALLSPGVTRSIIAAFAAGPGALPRPPGSAPARPGPPEPGAGQRHHTAQAGPDEPARPGVRPAADPGVAALTSREREVIALVAAGLSNDEIATKLTVSPLTAKTHVSRSMTKLNARDRAQLVVLAYEHGLAQPGQGRPS